MAIPVRVDKMLFGLPIKLNDNITIHTPTLEQIFDYGENEYFGLVYNLTATSYQLLLHFHENGIDYTQVSDYEVFCLIGSNLPKEETSILFGDLDLSKLQMVKDLESERVSFINDEGKVIIDEAIYYQIAATLRVMNNRKREFKIPGNDMTRQIYIREALLDREKAKRRPRKEYDSALINVISGLCNHPGFKYNYSTVKDISIYALFDALKRIQAINSYNHLMQCMSSGFVDTSKINKKHLDWLRDLNDK